MSYNINFKMTSKTMNFPAVSSEPPRKNTTTAPVRVAMILQLIAFTMLLLLFEPMSLRE